MNSIFRKQFFLLTAGLVVSFVLLTFGLLQAFNTYFYNQKETALMTQAQEIEKIYNRCYYNDKIDYKLLESKFLEYSSCFNYSFIVVNKDYNLIWQPAEGDKTLDIEEIKKYRNFSEVFAGNSITFERKKSSIDDSPFTLGYPIKYNGKQVAAVFLSSSVNQIVMTNYDSYRIIVIFMCLAIIINFVIIYYSSKKFAEPLKQMSDAARVIASGNFEKRLNIHTDDEIGDLANSFNEMALSMFFQEKRRREFISNISHDLRSPLTSMRGFLQAILDGTIPPEKQDHYLKIVLDESERLAKMANDMLDINKLDDSRESLNLSEFNLNQLVIKTLYNFEDRAVQSKIKVSTEFSHENIIVKADADKIQRVIYNLVDNSLKFTHKYGYIKIMTDIRDKKVYVSVKDNGKGISQEEQKRVFDRLYKGDKSRGKDKKGSGLGLSIVKEFIKVHNEELTLESEMGKGCIFTFSLPVVSKGNAINYD